MYRGVRAGRDGGWRATPPPPKKKKKKKKKTLAATIHEWIQDICTKDWWPFSGLRRGRGGGSGQWTPPPLHTTRWIHTLAHTLCTMALPFWGQLLALQCFLSSDGRLHTKSRNNTFLNKYFFVDHYFQERSLYFLTSGNTYVSEAGIPYKALQETSGRCLDFLVWKCMNSLHWVQSLLVVNR